MSKYRKLQGIEDFIKKHKLKNYKVVEGVTNEMTIWEWINGEANPTFDILRELMKKMYKMTGEKIGLEQLFNYYDNDYNRKNDILYSTKELNFRFDKIMEKEKEEIEKKIKSSGMGWASGYQEILKGNSEFNSKKSTKGISEAISKLAGEKVIIDDVLEELEDVLNRYKVSRKELANEINVSYNTIGRWINKETTPNFYRREQFIKSIKDKFNGKSFDEIVRMYKFNICDLAKVANVSRETIYAYNGRYKGTDKDYRPNLKNLIDLTNALSSVYDKEITIFEVMETN